MWGWALVFLKQIRGGRVRVRGDIWGLFWNQIQSTNTRKIRSILCSYIFSRFNNTRVIDTF